ncbi:MAG: OmpA family protein [Nitrospiraceae bacterium]|nr:MAG: OmpA family protein [Nitrospiraceae bacterium]
MRKLIIGLSILLYALSGIFIFKALTIPAPDTRSEERQAGDQALVKELQAKIATLENNRSTGDKEAGPDAEIKRSPQEVKVLAVFDGGTFNSGHVVMDENMMNSIKELSRNILASPEHRVVVEGHTDNMPIRPSPGKQYSDNTDLSYFRAKAVARILMEEGVPDGRITVTGYGDTRPIASNDTVEGRAKNRRVEVKLIPQDKEP